MERPNKHPAMIVHEERPFNAEPPLVRPRQSFLTPKDLFFSRNHGSIPEVDPEGYRLVVGGLVDRPLELSMGDLYGLPKMEVVAVLQCAGNRRNGLMQVAPIPGETPLESWRHRQRELGRSPLARGPLEGGDRRRGQPRGLRRARRGRGRGRKLQLQGLHTPGEGSETGGDTGLRNKR